MVGWWTVLAACTPDAGLTSTSAVPTWDPDTGTPTTAPTVETSGIDGDTLSFRIRSRAAERVEVWLYADPFDAAEVGTLTLQRHGDDWLGTASAADLGLDPAAVWYGLRLWGPNWPHDPSWTPGSEAGFVADVDSVGNRFDPNKLVIDPHARELSHDPTWAGHTDATVYLSGPDHRATDSAPYAPKALLIDPHSVAASEGPDRPLRDDVIYEVHLRGLTMADPTVPEALRGTYAGAALKAPYLADLGITAIELLPIHETWNDQNDLTLEADGDNYWGYSSLAFLAPDRRYAADRGPGGPTREFAEMVTAFHDHGLKVFVDVVYNHTGESGPWDADGQVAPLLSWRGVDNAAYYELDGPSGYRNDNGVGPNVNAADPLARDLVIDSLRTFAHDLGVDGFRFDLAPILGNGCLQSCFDFDADDPDGVLQRALEEVDAELIAEPWAIGPGTYQAGNFGAGWAEWNDATRDLLRTDLNRLGTDEVTPRQLADTLAGSPDRFGDDGRAPWHAVDFVVAHDGFTLIDLFSCDDKDNDQDWPFGPSDGGSDHNLSANHGDPALQRQVARTALGLLAVGAGTPMVTGGDEFLRSQRCNNNPYNLDSEGTWLDWSQLDDPDAAAFHTYARGLWRFRAAHPALRPADWRTDDAIAWFTDAGVPADDAYLDDPSRHALAFRLAGAPAGDPAPAIFVAYNGWDQGVAFTLPATLAGGDWHLVSDSNAWLEDQGNVFEPGQEGPLPVGAPYLLGGRSLLLLIEK